MGSTPTWATFYQMLQQMQSQGLPPPMPPGPNDWVNNVQPDGSLAGAQVTPTPPGYGTPGGSHTVGNPPAQAPNPGAVAGQSVGGPLGAITGQAAYQAMTGSAPSAATTAASSAPAASTAASAGTELIGPPEFVGPPEFIGPQMPATGTSWFSSYGAPALGAAGIALGSYGMYDLLKNREPSDLKATTQGAASGAALGAGLGSFVPVVGTGIGAAIGAGVGGLAGLASSQFGSGKDFHQRARDGVRSELVNTGFLNPDYTLTLPDGTTFDWGKDGNARLPNEGKDPITGQDWRHYYDVDWSKGGNIGGLVAAANPLAAVFARGDKNLTEHLAGYIVNTAAQSSDPLAAIQAMIEKAGMGHDQIYGAVHLLSKSQGGPLADNLADAYKNGLDQMYGVGAYEGQGSQLGTPDIQYGQKPVIKPPKPVMPATQGGEDDEETPQASPSAATPPQGAVGNAQPKPMPRSPFVGSPMHGGTQGLVGGQKQGPFIASKQRISPGVWQDQKGQYLSKTGVRGK